MKSKYSLIAGCIILMGCTPSDGVYDGYGRDALFQRIESRYAAEDFSSVREAAESFVTRFPQDDQIDLVRLKLLSAYIDSKRYRLASAYADRLLSGVLLNEAYYEDVEYYQVLLLVQKSQHWMAVSLKLNDVFRNYVELEDAIGEIRTFVMRYPNSAYLDELKGYEHKMKLSIANYELGVALHYAKKGNFKAASARMGRYYANYSDIEASLLGELLAYPELALEVANKSN